jgi:DNA-binding GntR family transcriptional regulator
VADADFSAIKAVYIQRMLLEPYAMRRATRRISHRDLDRAADLLDRMNSAATGSEVVSVPELNRQFHFLFYDACGNDALSTQIEQLWQRWPWDLLSVIKDRPNESQKEHAEMIEAVRSGNVAQVAQATEQHLRASYMSLGRHLTGAAPEDVFDLDVD